MDNVTSDDQAAAITRAACTVASAGGTLPLSTADRRAISGALVTVFNRHDALDLDHLAPIASTDLARIVDDPAMGLDLVRVLAVLALLDGVVEQAKLELVIDVASALHLHAEFVDGIQQLGRDHVHWVADDTIRANVATIPGLPFGRAFHGHYQRNGYAFSGHWDFWSHIDAPLDDLRAQYSIPPLDPRFAAVEDEHVARADFERPGVESPPKLSSVPIADRLPATAKS